MLTRRNLAGAAAVLLILLVGARIARHRVTFHVTPDHVDACARTPAEVEVSWSAHGTRWVSIYVYGVGEKPKLWTTGRSRGSAKTGPWVSDGMTIMLKDGDGKKTLAMKTIESVPCTK